MNQTKRARRMFRPGLDALEGRLVLSSASAAHQQALEQRHLLHAQLVARQRAQQLRHEQQAKIVPAASTSAGAQSVVVGTPSDVPATSVTGSSSSQASATGSSTVSKKVPLTQIPQVRLVPSFSMSVMSSTSSVSSGTSGTTVSPTTSANSGVMNSTMGTTAGGVTPVFIVNDQRDVSLGARTPIVVGTNAGGLNNFTSNLAIQFIQNNGNSTGLISTTNAVSGTGATFGIAFL